MNGAADKVLVGAFAFLLGGLLLFNLAGPDRGFSPMENRYLAKKPPCTPAALLSGRFSRQFEDYVTDEFAFRDQWVYLKGDMERLLLRRENKGIFLGRDGFLLENFRGPGAALARNIERINRLAQACPQLQVSLLLAPNSVALYPDKLPLFASVYSQAQVIEDTKTALGEGVDFVPVLEALWAERGQDLYYRTDHHWTMAGAYLAYRQLAPFLGFQPLPPSAYYQEVVARDFQGTYSAKAGNRWLKGEPIVVWQLREPVGVTVRFNDRKGTFPSLFFPEHLATRDKYAYFLDGNHPLAVIHTEAGQGGKIAVFKDSFAHALVPFLAPHFEEIHLIDLRFFDASPEEYLQEQEIDRVLFLYSVSAFAG